MTDDIIPPKLQGRFPDREHTHKWFPWQTKAPFEPAKVENGVTYWVQVEYAYLSCGCGEVMKKLVNSND